MTTPIAPSLPSGLARELRLNGQGFPWPLNCLGYRLCPATPGCRGTTTGQASACARGRYAAMKGRRS